jgi:predicted negative regulator of RcsB-dependent stress response
VFAGPAEGKFVRAEARHQLKQDRFSKVTIEAAERTVDWSVAHKSPLIVGIAILVVLAGALAAGWYYLDQQDQKASLEVSQAVRTLDTPLRPAGTPPQPEFPSFASSQARASEAHRQFQDIIDKYPHTRSAEFARYFLALTDADLGNTAAATHGLQTAASSHNEGLSGLAKFALASVDRNQNHNREAMEIYRGLINKPPTTVGKVTAQVALAETYEADHQPQEAKRVYQQIQKENPATEAAQLAAQKLQALK